MRVKPTSLSTCRYIKLYIGNRPVYTGLGGGDLDGDLYNVTTLRELMPPQNYHPANYDPAVKRILDRRSTIHDIADFVADYINSDVSLFIHTLYSTTLTLYD